MIIKHFEFTKDNIGKFNYYLFHGKNEGLKKEIIEKNFIKNFDGKIDKYDENYIISNKETIISELLSKSLFENRKIIIISRVTDKIIKVVDEIIKKTLDDIIIILKSEILEKRSKLRQLFEKEKTLASIALYEDTSRDLTRIITKFLNINKIRLSQESINLLVTRASGDRENLKIELEKIYNYSITNKDINISIIRVLTNLAENYSVNELAENFLLKNKKNISKILNENNYSDEDCILILRTILLKSKRLFGILKRNEELNNIDQVISSTKPPIFWKEKENVKIQANCWSSNDLKKKIYEINEIEFLVKNNSKNSLNLVADFIFNY
tara:strand:- start:6619 stop:7596 length:978 start_codon:yes stop_codon:yes gene_type:complete